MVYEQQNGLATRSEDLPSVSPRVKNSDGALASFKLAV